MVVRQIQWNIWGTEVYIIKEMLNDFASFKKQHCSMFYVSIRLQPLRLFFSTREKSTS